MNSVALSGRLTKNPELRYGGQENSTAIARFTLAVDDGRETDFINIKCFGRTAEWVEKWLGKSRVLSSIEQMEVNFEEVVAFDKEIERLHSEQDKYLGLRAGLYEDLKKQIITEEDFKNFREIYEKRYQELQQAITSQEETIKRLFKSGVTAGINLERMKTVMQVTELDRMTLVSLVKRILVYEDKRVYLELRSKELFSKVLMLAGYVETLGQSRGEAV